MRRARPLLPRFMVEVPELTLNFFDHWRPDAQENIPRLFHIADSEVQPSLLLGHEAHVGAGEGGAHPVLQALFDRKAFIKELQCPGRRPWLLWIIAMPV